MIRVSIACILTLCIGALAPTQQVHPLQGTELLTWQGDLSERMMDGAHRFVERKIDESIGNRQRYWNRDFTSRQAYEDPLNRQSPAFHEEHWRCRSSRAGGHGAVWRGR